MGNTAVLHRLLNHDYPVAVGGGGCELIDSSGRRYLDGSSGAAVSCLGHAHPDVLAAMHRQIDRLQFAHTSFFSSEPAEALAQDIISNAPGDLSLCQFVSGGSEAVEAALKLARQYHVEKGEHTRHRFIARHQSYHGSTLGALSVTGRRSARHLFEPMLMPVTRVSACYEYRGRGELEDSDRYAERLAVELEEEILRAGPSTIAGFIAETVVGATLGAVTAVPGYFGRVREICDRHGILMILDEVMAGTGRTGTLHAFEQEGVAPDLVVIAKGLGGGYAPIGAVLVSRRFAEVLRVGSGAFNHGHTYLAHPIACAAALAVQHVIRRDGLLANVRSQGELLRAGLESRLATSDWVGDIRGRGLLVGIELVEDRATKRPFPSSFKVHAHVRRQALERGLTIFGMGGTADGEIGDHLMLAPPYIVDSAIIAEMIERTSAAIEEGVAEARSQGG